jgi:hypothetical protein
MKVALRYTESTSGPIIKPQWPLVFDLNDDPGEAWDLMDKRLDCIWVLGPVVERLAALQKSAARYPNIKPGEAFTSYA